MKRLYRSLALLLLGATLFAFFTHACTASETTAAITKGSVLADCTFFGDSTTYGLHRFNANNDGRFGKNYYTLQDSQIWTPADGTFYLGNVVKASVHLSGKTYTLAEACRTLHPQNLIVTVGINGLAAWTKETFSSCYEKLVTIIRDASPDTMLYLQSVYPIAPEAKEKLPKFSNEKIIEVNRWIKELAERNALCYLDTATVLRDENGSLKHDYHNGDGLHLSTDGFNAMLRYVEDALTKGTV